MGNPRLFAMHWNSHLLPTAYAMGAVLCWGAADFLGGFIAKRVNAFLVAFLAHGCALIFMSGAAFASRAPLPGNHSALWALGAGALGGTALVAFYSALASGHMGLIAPVSAVMGAAIPAVFALFVEGLPHRVQIAGFVLAAIGIWFISQPEGDSGRPEGLGLALLAGAGFAGYFICVHQAGDASALWISAVAKVSSLAIVGLLILLWRIPFAVPWRWVLASSITGILDVSGSAFFVRAGQSGRLDVAVILASLYPAVTVLLARFFLRERFTLVKALGMAAALAAVPMVAMG